MTMNISSTFASNFIMPRLPRLAFPGLFSHVIARGIERRPLFKTHLDYGDFVSRLARLLPETGTACFAWALMPNHVHLFLMSGLTTLSKVMQRLLTGYAVNFNIRHKRVGHLFQNRYKSIICQEEPYFLQLIRYIGLNPVRAGIVKTPEELAHYPWTSHAAILGTQRNTFQDVKEVLSRFGSDMKPAQRAYQLYILDGWSEGHREDLEGGGLIRSLGGVRDNFKIRQRQEPQSADVRILGDGLFVDEILHRIEQKEREASEANSYSWPVLLKTVSELMSIDPAALSQKRLDRAASKAKSLLLFAGVEWLGRSLTETAAFVKMSAGCASRSLRRGQKLAEKIGLIQDFKRQQGNYVP